MRTCCPALFAILCIHVNAQELSLPDSIRTEDLREVRISADRTYGADALSTEQVSDAGLMNATGALQVSDAVKYFSGITVKDYGGIGGLKTVSVRGLGASHTAVALDGVMITDSQTGQIDLGRFSAGRTGSVRLVSGPDNDMLQSAAMAAQAATVNISLHKPELDGQRMKSRAQLKAGSFHTVSAQAQTDFLVCGSSAVSTNVEWLQTGGDYPYIQNNGSSSGIMKRKNSDVRRLSADAALFSGIGQSDLNVRACWYQSEQGLPANILYNENAASERLWNRDAFIQATLRSALGSRLTLQTVAKYGMSRTRYLDRDVNNSSGSTDNRYLERECHVSAVLLYRIAGRLSASAAVDGRRSELQGVSSRYILNSSAALKYASESLVLTARLNHIATREHALDGLPAAPLSHLSPVFAANWTVWPAAGLHVRASYQNTLRLPTFNDLYFEQVGRRDLRPERAQVASAGLAVEHAFRHLSLSMHADAYDSRVRDRILAVPGSNTAVWMMKNVGLVTTHGFETGLELACSGPVRYGTMMSYTYQRAMDKSREGGTTWNHQMPYTPRHSAAGTAFLETRPLCAGVNVIYSGKYFCNAYNGPEYAMPSYYELGFSLWRDLKLESATVRLKAECMNLTDSRYEVVRNYPMPGRQIRLTASVDL